MRVTVHSHNTGNGQRWVVSRRAGGKRKRAFFTSKAAAEAEASRLRFEISQAGEAWLHLSAQERTKLIGAWADARQNGIDIIDIIALIEQAKHAPKSKASPALADVVTELMTAKRNAGRADRYLETLGFYLGAFSTGRDRMPIAALGLPQVESFLDGYSIHSRPTLRARLSTLFHFAIRRGYRTDNPCDRLESITVARKPPQVFTLAQMETCLERFRDAPRGAAWFALTTVCGLRPEEAEKTTRADIHFGEGWVKVEAQTTKIRQRRVVYPRPDALALLRRAVDAGAELPISFNARRWITISLRKPLGFKKWPQDITRHTAASYWLSSGASAKTVAENLGHSESTLLKHYRALVTRKEARKFWHIVSEYAKKV